ncbi:hypothetical protein, partial [Pannonibacter sp. CS1GBFMT1]|uniref:hypothetical protein n=1 Tax=Pannonibacter sp. CS1GBFMT1 TaxID=2003581 RepID=UPI001AD8CECD
HHIKSATGWPDARGKETCMNNVFAAYLNEAGVAHVAEELKRLGLDWDVASTCDEIEKKPGFLDMYPDGSYEYEISNNDVGKRGYGAFGWINIEPVHVHWEPLAN